jgi:hypothetical protein
MLLVMLAIRKRTRRTRETSRNPERVRELLSLPFRRCAALTFGALTWMPFSLELWRSFNCPYLIAMALWQHGGAVSTDEAMR